LSVPRRQFLKTTTAATMGFLGLRNLVGAGYCSDTQAVPHLPFPDLVPDPVGVVELLPGFDYRIVSVAGRQMDDGLLVPAGQDGMAAFGGPNGSTVLICNHELTQESRGNGAFGDNNELLAGRPTGSLFDAGHRSSPCLGGTTTMIYDTRSRRLEHHHMSLAGTVRNCAGGQTPWHSWISCEETPQLSGEALEQDHGFNFEVPAGERGLAAPAPLKAMGRFVHEAVAVDPVTGIVYETEDRGDSLFYRFIPNRKGVLREGGKLQALVARDTVSLDTRNWEAQSVRPGAPFPVRWIDIDNVLAPQDDLRFQGFANGAARFARGEGIAYGNGALYFVCTSGGKALKGQVWRYEPSPHEGAPDEEASPGTLELFIEPNDASLVDNADNLTVTPWGDLLLCEDGPEEQFLVGVTPGGNIYKFARNTMNFSEFAGAAFSPDATTLFVNIQWPGMTLAMHGPWHSLAEHARRADRS
jgi:secreted PhoX family phosphatase